MQVQVLSRAPIMQKTQKIQPVVKIIPHYLIIILLFGIGLLVYHRAILKGVLLFDDKALIIDNPMIKNFSYLKEIFTTHLFHGSGIYSNFYRPVQSLSFMLDYHFWQLNPFGYHLTNVLIHICTAALVYFFIWLIAKKQDIAIITSLLFCVHTALSWPVNYAASRADLLSLFFILLAAIAYVLYKERTNLLLLSASLIFFISAVLSKEVAVIFPFILILYLHCFRKQVKEPKKISPDLIWVFFIFIIIYALLRITALDFTKGKLLETTTGAIPLHIRLLTTSKAVMIYLKLLVLPLGLHMEWDIKPAMSFMQDEVFLSVVALSIIAGFTYFLFRTSKLKFFAISWFFIALLPYSNIFPLSYFMGEGWLYVPSIGFFALWAIYLSELRRKSKTWSLAVTFIVVFLVVFYGILTVKRADVWADPVRLYAEVLKYSPNNAKARINLGVLLAESGFHEDAVKKYKEAAKLMPNDSGTHSNLGVVYANKQMHDMALEEFKKAAELNPNDYVAHNNIGILYKRKGDTKRAMEEYTKALEINPYYPLTYNNIGNIYLESGRYDDAIVYYKKAIGLDPNKALFYENLGKAYRNKGMINEAEEVFEKALKLNPDNKNSKRNN